MAEVRISLGLNIHLVELGECVIRGPGGGFANLGSRSLMLKSPRDTNSPGKIGSERKRRNSVSNGANPGDKLPDPPGNGGAESRMPSTSAHSQNKG